MPKNEVAELNEMYIRIEELCRQHGINVTQMCRDADIPRGNLTDLKKGRTAALATKNLGKIASYFGVSVDYLLGTEKEKAPIPKDECEIGFDDFTYALNKEVKELTESDKALLLSLARQFNNARKQGDGKKTD